jgi:hypothetical protein
VAVAAGCAACAPWPPLPDGGAPGAAGPLAGEARPAVAARAADEGLAAFLARATPGETATIAGAGGGLLVTVAQDYHAASGKACRRLQVGEDGASPREREACRDELGVWRLLPLLHNRELSRLSAEGGGGS